VSKCFSFESPPTDSSQLTVRPSSSLPRYYLVPYLVRLTFWGCFFCADVRKWQTQVGQLIMRVLLFTNIRTIVLYFAMNTLGCVLLCLLPWHMASNEIGNRGQCHSSCCSDWRSKTSSWENTGHSGFTTHGNAASCFIDGKFRPPASSTRSLETHATSIYLL
jgi:hypothetical protein